MNVSMVFACSCCGLLLAASTTIAQENSPVLPEVEVSGKRAMTGEAAEGYRVDAVCLGPLGESAARELLFSVQSISAQLIQNTAATNSTEALKYAPTIYNNTGGGQITPYFTVRGFSVSTWTYNMALDGMRSFDIWQPLEDKERIDVMNGASSFLYGITSPGGMFHYALKRPLFGAHASVTLGNDDRQFHTRADFGGLLGGREDMGYRINLGYGDRGETGLRKMTQEHYVLSGALAWRASADTRLDLDFSVARRGKRQHAGCDAAHRHRAGKPPGRHFHPAHPGAFQRR